MIELSHKGANHGWSVMEGTHPFLPGRKRGPTPIVPPIVEHHHSDCRSITGGYVYQGAKFKELRDAYLYGDYQYGKVWGLRYDYKAKKVTWHKVLAIEHGEDLELWSRTRWLVSTRSTMTRAHRAA